MKQSSSWEGVSDWYDRVVGQEGHYYHKALILPNVLKILNLREGQNVIDFACGQGIFARSLKKGVGYLGLDGSKTLVSKAKGLSSHPFEVQDLCVPFEREERFDAGVMILAFQNLSEPSVFLKNAAALLKKGARLVLVLNHPCFRIPRQSSWGVDEAKKLQYRRIDRYMGSMAIPLSAHPSKEDASIATFHWPLSAISRFLSDNGFAIELLDEWCSDKVSEGKMAKMENRCREEFPLFLAVVAKKT